MVDGGVVIALDTAHVGPVYCEPHKHMKSLPVLKHLPPFKQGFDEQPLDAIGKEISSGRCIKKNLFY